MATTKIINFTIFGYTFTLHKKKVFKHVSKRPNPHHVPGIYSRGPNGENRRAKWLYKYAPKIKDWHGIY